MFFNLPLMRLGQCFHYSMSSLLKSSIFDETPGYVRVYHVKAESENLKNCQKSEKFVENLKIC